MAVDYVLLSEMVSGIPSRGIGLHPEEMEIKRRFVWIATSDIAILIARDKKFAVPALVRDHAGGRACDTWLCVCLLYAFDPSHMLHGKMSPVSAMVG